MDGMKRFALPLILTATLAIVVTLFHLKQQVGDLERELSQVNRQIVAHRETIQVLRTEWSFLNQPARIAELAERHLGMRRNQPEQLIRLDDLPLRGPLSASADLASGARETGGLQ